MMYCNRLNDETFFFQALISLRRIGSFLNEEELEDISQNPSSSTSSPLQGGMIFLEQDYYYV